MLSTDTRIFSPLLAPIKGGEGDLAQVKQRVLEGGHNIPDQDIGRRFESGFRNFHTLYSRIVKDWALYDNSGDVPILLEEGVNDER